MAARTEARSCATPLASQTWYYFASLVFILSTHLSFGQAKSFGCLSNDEFARSRKWLPPHLMSPRRSQLTCQLIISTNQITARTEIDPERTLLTTSNPAGLLLGRSRACSREQH